MNNYESILQDQKEKIDNFFKKEFSEYDEAYKKLAGGEDKETDELEEI